MGIYGDQRLNYVVRPKRSGQVFGWILLIACVVGLGVFAKFYLDKNPGALENILNTIQSQYRALVSSDKGSTTSANKADRFNENHLLQVKDLQYLVVDLATYFQDSKGMDLTAKFEKNNRQFGAKMDELIAGKKYPLLEDRITGELVTLEKSWNSMSNEVRLVLEHYPLKKKFTDAVAAIHKISDEMVGQNDKLLKRLVTSKMSKKQFQIISRQNYYLQSIQTQTSKLLSSGLEMSAPSERLGEDMTRLSKVYEGLLSGSRAYGVTRLRHSGLRGDVKKIVANLKKLQEQIAYVLDISPDIYELRERQQKISSSRNNLLSEFDKLVNRYGNS